MFYSSSLTLYLHVYLTVLLQEKGKGNALVKNDALEEQDAQNLEIVAFCEDIAS